jgi:hypothetical protein
MCDGYYHQGGVMICMENFLYEEQLRFCEILKKKFEILASPVKYMGKYRIFIRKTSMKK